MIKSRAVRSHIEPVVYQEHDRQAAVRAVLVTLRRTEDCGAWWPEREVAYGLVRFWNITANELLDELVDRDRRKRAEHQ